MQKNADISKYQGVLVLKTYFLKLHMFAYLRTKFEVPSIILTTLFLDRGVWFCLPPLPPPQNECLKSPSRLGFSLSRKIHYIIIKKKQSSAWSVEKKSPWYFQKWFFWWVLCTLEFFIIGSMMSLLYNSLKVTFWDII